MTHPTGPAHHHYGKRGRDVPNWRGGRITEKGGYILTLVPRDHEFIEMARWKGGSAYISEHRLVMAESLGRALSSDELVHHIDGDVTNNVIANLELTERAEHGRFHAEQRTRAAGVFV